MSKPITVDILSDDDDEHLQASTSTPLQILSKNQRTDSNSNPTVFVIDDDPTPQKFSKSRAPMVQCSNSVFDPHLGSSSLPDPDKSSGISALICLESDNESESGLGSLPRKKNEIKFVSLEVANNSELNPAFVESPLGNAYIRKICDESSWHPLPLADDLPQVPDSLGEEADRLQRTDNISRLKGIGNDDANKKKNVGKAKGKKRIASDEKVRLMNEKKQKKEQEKLQKAAEKAEAAEKKRQQKEIQKWEKGAFALKSIVAKIDTKVAESGSVGGHLLTRLAEKGLTYQITSNPIERSIVWTMSVPENISQAWTRGTEIQYVLLVYEAEEFCKLVTNESIVDHVSHIRCLYPSHTICYLTNRLAAYINKREQQQYNNHTNHSGWKRPPVEEMLSKLTTHFVGVHSRLSRDEAEVAEHVVGLTCSLASCQFRKKLTRLSVDANGSLVPKDCPDRTLIKKSLWLKALIAIPKVQPRFAIAIYKKYPTMKSLLSVYMDSSKTVHEKEFLLEDLTAEGLLGDNRRLGQICSKRVYRILMAQCGNIKTDDVENGAAFFNCQSS